VKLALIGDPVDESASPALHRRLLEKASLEGSYVPVRVPAGRAAEAIAQLRADGFAGCNVTYPLKSEAYAACDRLTAEASRIEAVNTIAFGDGAFGTNTDGVGARTALESLAGEPMALARVGVLGYGATARAILSELQETDAYAFVWGRDASAVAAVCRRFEAQPWPDDNVPEIVVSTLPPETKLPAALVGQLQRPDFVVDVNYGRRATLAAQLGRDVVDGEAMLEAQARAAFDFWLAQLAGVETGTV
jgi:shikimate dehydrogenase